MAKYKNYIDSLKSVELQAFEDSLTGVKTIKQLKDYCKIAKKTYNERKRKNN